ncbi:MAG TPA: hypothetical protein VHZ95_06420, partial [Polyangiales bacterium]|nr:hypothetical protein [Polyangiales bacterium]
LVVWIVDPEHAGGVAAIAKTQLRACLFHEVHHLVRDSTIARDSMLDTAVTGGMATVFERDFAQAAAPWGWYPVDVGRWLVEIRRLPNTTDRRPWLFRPPDGRRWILHKVGAYLVDRAGRTSGKSAADLVVATTDSVITLARSAEDSVGDRPLHDD